MRSSKETYPVCVRHMAPRKDTRLRNFFLCDDCSEEWTNLPFGGNRPLYVGEKVRGYCLLCNSLRNDVCLRVWFLCDICERVAKSIGRNHVAEHSILEFWAKDIAPKFPSLKLIQNDPSQLRPVRPGAKSGTAPLDFLVRDGHDTTLVGIENKSGRSSIREMSKFQLDVSDCDCILNEMRTLNVPAYVIHAQVLEIWEPPTVGFTTVGLWWSDVYRMADNFVRVEMRRDERRGAALFAKAAFKEINSFAELLFDGPTLDLVKRFRAEGVPMMYSADGLQKR